MNSKMHSQRLLVAEMVYAIYNFGASFVQDADGWESSTGSDEVYRTVYLESEENDDEDACENTTLSVSFRVAFKPDSVEVSDVSALIKCNGSEIGSFDEDLSEFSQEAIKVITVQSNGLRRQSEQMAI